MDRAVHGELCHVWKPSVSCHRIIPRHIQKVLHLDPDDGSLHMSALIRPPCPQSRAIRFPFTQLGRHHNPLLAILYPVFLLPIASCYVTCSHCTGAAILNEGNVFLRTTKVFVCMQFAYICISYGVICRSMSKTKQDKTA